MSLNSAQSQSQAPQSGARKRSNSTNEDGSRRPVKHRASLACQSCRSRKVRCDVVANGARCTNCRLDKLECIVLPSRRGKNNHNSDNGVPHPAGSLPPPQADIDIASPSDRDARWTNQDPVATSVTSSGAGQVPACVTFENDPENVDGDRQPEAEDTVSNAAYNAHHETYDEFLTPDTGTNTSKQYQSPEAIASLPTFIKPLSSHVLSEDLNFLVQKGAMTLPEPEMQLEIIRGYLFSVHPFMPMLNVKQFLNAILNNREEARISLLLFQAVMFAGLHSLPLHVINRLGFESTKQAREVFFNRVRFLYELDVEPDSAAVLPSLILMSSWFSRRYGRRHTWHWTGLAYDVARSMGLNREPAGRSAPAEIRHFRRRLWWSLYIRDRMIALGTRRPMRIRDDDFSVTMLTLEDFELETLEGDSQLQALMPSAEERTATALMCIQLTKLCVCVGSVMSSQYTTLSTQPDVPFTMVIVPRRDAGRIEDLERCDRELNEWFQALGPNVRRTGSHAAQNDPHSCSEIHWATLHMTYLTTVNVLHRAQALQPLTSVASAQMTQKSSRSKVKEAARGLTKLSQSMLRQGQVRFLGLIGVTALIAACLSHMLDVTSGDEDIRDASTFRLYQTLEVLQVLRMIYASADAAVAFLESVARTAGISIPAQLNASNADYTSASVQHSVESLLRSSAGRQEASSLRNERPNTAKAYWHVDHFQNRSPMASNGQQSQASRENDRQVLNIGGLVNPPAPLSPPARVLASSGDAQAANHRSFDVIQGGPSAEPTVPHAVDAMYGRPSNSAAGGIYLDWTTGNELEPMAFNYDFYSDAFGFSDVHLQRI